MTLLTEGRYAGDFLVSEASGARSRDEISIVSGKLGPGTVLGKITTGSATATAGGENVGNGAMGTVTVNHNAIPGDYTLEITEEAANAGAFTITDPRGNLVGTGNVASAFTSTHLSFTLADGGEDFDEGDVFTIAVATVPGQYGQYTPGDNTGLQTAAGVLWGAVDATEGAKTGVAITRDAEVNAAELVWPAGATDAQIATGIGQLEGRGIVARLSYS